MESSPADGEPTVGAATVSDDASGRDAAHDIPKPGTSVGRYVLTSHLGSGGMGVVMGAHDPELDRDVAIKVLHRIGERHRARLLREAQGLARLNHPNIVTIHDVGEDRGRVFLAMELVDGQTLDRWLTQCSRDWRDIVRAFVEAGRGLAAAHAEGLVHRDFKPQNVMVGADDRIRVMDFGLVLDARPASDDVQLEEDFEGSVQSKPADATAAGAWVGTVGYMAPEQFTGDDVGPAADQFSFCVALYQALFGTHPFPGDSPAARAAQVTTGQARPPRDTRGAPRRLVRTLLRGLERAPTDRWSAMPELLGQLDTAPSRTRWILASLAATAAAGVFLWPEGSSCPDGTQRLAGIWDAHTKAAAQDAFVATQLPYAQDTWDRTSDRIDQWTQAWVQAYESNCHDTRAGGSRSQEEMQRRATCLNSELSQLKARTELLTEADPHIVRRAMDIAIGLGDADACTAMARQDAPADPIVAADVQAIKTLIHRCEAFDHAGKNVEFLQCATQASRRAHATKHPPVQVRAQHVLAIATARAGKYAETVKLDEQVYFQAVRAGLDNEARAAALVIAHVLATELDRVADAREWLDHASSHPGDGSPTSQAQFGKIEVLVLRAESRFEEAIARARELVRHSESDDPSDTLDSALSVLGRALSSAGDYTGAARVEHRGLALRRKLYGEEHPFVAEAENNLGTTLFQLGRYEDAQRELEKAAELRRLLYTFPHPRRASTMANLAAVLRERGDLQRALDIEKEAALEFAMSLGPDHPHHGFTLVNISLTLGAIGQYPEARRVLDQGLAILETSMGPGEPGFVKARSNLGRLLARQGEIDRAIEIYEEIVRDAEGLLDETHPVSKMVRVELGVLLMAQGRHVPAMDVLDRALTGGLREQHPGLWARGTAAKARCLIALGRVEQALEVAREATSVSSDPASTPEPSVLWALALAEHAAGSSSEARAHAADASAQYERLGEQDARRQIEDWLASH